MGLDPGSPGSHPRLKAVRNHWATGAALFPFLKKNCGKICTTPNLPFLSVQFFFKKRFYLFNWHRDTEREHEQREGQREREKQMPHWAGSPTPDSIPGPRDHDLNRRQMLHQLSHPCAPAHTYKFTGQGVEWWFSGTMGRRQKGSSVEWVPSFCVAS